MTRRALIVAALAACIGSTFALGEAPRPRSVLFIGNSLTYGAYVPQVTEAMLVAQRVPHAMNQHTIGAATLGSLWSAPDAEGEDARKEATMSARQKIAARKWGFVVLQDQSQLPAVAPDQTLDYGKRFCDAAKAQGAVPIVYATWGYNNDPKMLDALTATYVKAAKENGALLAPVGLAFAKAAQADARIALLAEDGIHATLQGGYLAACVFYATLTGESPVGLPAKLIGKNRAGKRGVLSDLSPAVARTLQQAAWDAVNEAHEKLDVATTIKHLGAAAKE